MDKMAKKGAMKHVGLIIPLIVDSSARTEYHSQIKRHEKIRNA